MTILLWRWNDPDIRLGGLPALRILFLGFRIRNRSSDDHIFAVLPVYRSRYLVLCRELTGIEEAENFIKVATRGHRISQHGFDFLVRTDHKNRPYSRVIHGRAALRTRSGSLWKHVIRFCDGQRWVANQRIIDLVSLRFFDVLGPFLMIRNRIHTQTDDLAIPFLELRTQLCHVSEFSRAYGCEVFGV